MRIVINESGRIIGQAESELTLQKNEQMVVISRDLAKVTNLVTSDARVRYLGPWGSTPAYLVERAA